MMYHSIATVFKDREGHLWYITHAEDMFAVPYFKPGPIEITYKDGDYSKAYGQFVIDKALVKEMANYPPHRDRLYAFPADKPFDDIFWNQVHKIKQKGDYANVCDQKLLPGCRGCIPIDITVIVDSQLNIVEALAEYEKEKQDRLNKN